MITKILDAVKNQTMSVSDWVLGFVGIIFVRFILEALSNHTYSGIIASDSHTLVHYGLFYICITLILACTLGYFSKDYRNILKIILFGLPLLWLGPIFDIVISSGNGYTMSYIFDTHRVLFFDFFKFFSPQFMYGATYGIRIEIILIVCSIGWYTWSIKKSVWKGVLVALVSYTAIFIVGSMPGVLYTLSHVQTNASSSTEVSRYLENLVFESNMAHNTMHEGVLSVSTEKVFRFGFDKLMSQILFIISLLFASFLFWKIEPKKFKSIVKNARLERIGSYIALLSCGMGFAYIHGYGNPFVWVDALGIICLLVSWISLWMYAVHENDIVDIDIDTVSNTNRPLVQKEVTPKEMREIGYIWLIVALLGSWCAGFYPFFMSLVYIATSHIYSSPPLRLRRFPFISSFLISVACLATILAGFFFISVNKDMQTFPTILSIGILIMVTLAINVKDMKDIEGDRANGIITIPILFGKYGAKVTGFCFALSFLLVPIFLKFYSLYIVAIPCAIVGYRLVIKKPYRENPIFIVRFVFLSVVAILYTATYWVATTRMLY